MADDAAPIEIGDELRELINNALVGGYPAILATVSASGQPRLSYRGSLQVFSKDQLGFWARNAGGETLDGLGKNPNVAMMLRKPDTRAIVQMTGRARVVTGAERDAVYDAAPEFERRADAEKKGVAVVIDLDVVSGGMPGADGAFKRFRMVRA